MQPLLVVSKFLNKQHILGTFGLQALIYGLSKTGIERHYHLNNFLTKRFPWNIRYKRPPLLKRKPNHLVLVAKLASIKWQIVIDY